MTAGAQKQLSNIRPIRVDSGTILLLDQRRLPGAVEYFDATALDAMCFAIRDMVVRGAPAIGVAAALALAAEARRLARSAGGTGELLAQLSVARERLQATRPTAVNLRWATDEIYELAAQGVALTPADLAEKLFARAAAMVEEDIETNMKMGEHGADLLPPRCNVLTHCNAGALATCGWGTALGVIRTAFARSGALKVYVDETRPRQQGARLTTWELLQDKIPNTLITDSMAGYLMSRKEIDVVIVGADRIAANGDTANKIGTYTLAVLADVHGIPFYVAAPLSTIDRHAACGDDIPIEQRDPGEVTDIGSERICPDTAQALNPAFDVTPGRLISAIITEAGVLRPPYERSIEAALNAGTK